MKMVMGMVTKITRNGYAKLLVSPKSKCVFPSSALLKNPFHQRSSIISEYSTLSPSQLWKICRRNGVVSGTMIRNALCKGRANIPATRFNNSNSDLITGIRRSFFKRFSTDGAVIGLIATNVAVFLLWKVADNEFMVKNFMISVDNFKSGRLHALITSGFSHRDTFHFATNIIGLYLFGTRIGRVLGQQYLLMLYLSGAVAGSICNLMCYSSIDPSLSNDQGVSYSKYPAQGASGAVVPIVSLGISLLLIKSHSLGCLPTLLSHGYFGMLLLAKDNARVLERNSGVAIAGGAIVSTVVCFKYWKVLLRR